MTLASEVLGPVIGELEQVFDALTDLAGRMAGLVAAGGPFRRAELALLRPLIFEVLDAHRGLVAGAGVVTAPGLLVDAPRWLEWWWTTASGAPEALRVNLDPGAPDFYDYTSTDWFATAGGAGGARRVVGPYVDYACTGEYAFTLSTAVPSENGVLGVAAADILASSLEGRVMPALTAISYPVALVGTEGRIIASNSPQWPPGLRLPPDHRARREPSGSEPGGGRPGGDGPSRPSPDLVGLPSPFRSWLLVEVAAQGRR